ncbi:type II toxin-antitoxin system PemK/MazF family toxin [Ammoniphilus sp. CFH 90114]|uniref:type II toxin-antitoxin system PemK/MazF family toxin n=1 Tax=Ammoniphilus sp. CFH 90114 TaxID=2493665 RepID=UPI00100EFC69|nr:type II toxin-antitoxin system PemK/MazF family toxin [Ammoniphilus sp. CFH 90114]RXT03563.1 hypothetical protein EIZ39_23820 [Ammoniphilus sp. CFH 90114]
MRIDFTKLRRIISSSTSASRNAIDSSESLSEFTASIANYIEHNHRIKENEMAMITMSMEDWRRKRNNRTYSGSDPIKIGDIFYADLGLTYSPELAYNHPVVILEQIRGLYLVLPVSTSHDSLTKAYHPILNPTGKKFLRKVLASEGEGFLEDSAILISNMRTISPARLHGDKKGSMNNVTDPSSLFQEIRNTAFKMAFPKLESKSKRTYSLINKLWNNRRILQEKIKLLEEEKKLLTTQINLLQNQTENN